MEIKRFCASKDSWRKWKDNVQNGRKYSKIIHLPHAKSLLTANPSILLKEIGPEYSLKDWCWSWNANTLATWYKLTCWKRPWCWERVEVGGEGDDRRWDGWMASPTRWTWVRVRSGSWWWTGNLGVLQTIGSQSWIRLSDWTELNKSSLSHFLLCETLWTAAHQVPPSMEFFRQEYCTGLLCPPGYIPDSGIEPEFPRSPALTGGFFTTSTTWEALMHLIRNWYLEYTFLKIKTQ